MAAPQHYATLPKTVRIGCYTFRVEVVEFEDAEAEGTFGHMNPVSQKIRLRPGMTPQNLANTFIHEILHGINWHNQTGVHTVGDYHLCEEEFVTKTANGLCAFWQDNPRAVEWWKNTVTAKVTR